MIEERNRTSNADEAELHDRAAKGKADSRKNAVVLLVATVGARVAPELKVVTFALWDQTWQKYSGDALSFSAASVLTKEAGHSRCREMSGSI